MLNTSKPSSSSKGDEASKPVKKRQKSSKTSAKETGSKSTDRCEPPVVSSAEEMNAEGKHWYELLEKKIGLDINAKEWMKKHPNLAHENKSELLIRLAHELCLAKNTEYDPGNENEEQNNKYAKFDSRRIFALFSVANDLIEQSDRKSFVEFVCKKGNVQLLEMICQKEMKDARGNSRIEEQYKWNGTFTGYSKLIDLLQYVIDNRCSPEIVLCIAEKMYGRAHVLCNGEQHLDSNHAKNIKGIFGYPGSIVKEFLKQAIKLGYKDTVSVMLSGDIYHCIRLMKWEVFQENQEFREAYDIIKETVADVISSWVEDKQFCKDSVQNLLDQGIETDMKKMGKEDLIRQLEYLGEKVVNKARITKENLMKELKERGKKKGEVRLRPTVVGALISTLFFKHQDKAMKVVKGESLTLKTTTQDNSMEEKKCNELNRKINSEEPINGAVLELIELLNSSSHLLGHWFFSKVLAKVVNENLDKLQAVCTAICKEPMQKLLKGKEVHENVIDVLKFADVEILSSQITTSEIPSSCVSVGDHFVEDVNKMYSKKEAKEGCSESQSDELAFSGLTRKIIRDLKEKKDLTDEEKEDLISKAVSEIKKGIDILADGAAANIDVKDIFLSFELINSKIEREQKREIVELVCQKGNVQLLEMICQKEMKDAKGINTIDVQYKWNGTFTGYSKLIDLLQYVIDNRCSPEIVLCIAEKMYGRAHVLCNGEQYLDSNHAKNIKGIFGYPGSIVKEFLKQAIKLGYKDTVSVMLSGDIYHCIRLMKWQRFQENQEFCEAYDIIKETVADVISSWVEDKQFCKDSVQNLLDQGIETDMKKMGKEDLIRQLEYLGEKVVNKACITKENLMKELKERGKKKGEVRLRPTVVGALISTLFFKHQDKAMKVVKGESLTLKTIKKEKCERRKKLQELNEKVNSKESINNTALGLIESLNSGNHASNGWFFREVLAKAVNEKLDKLKAVCAAICKEPMEELLKGEEVHKNVIDVLQFFGVEKDFLLEKSIPGNSDDALVRNSQGVEETLSNRSEKSISSSSQQSSADHDPQSSTVPISQGEKSLPNTCAESEKTQQQSLVIPSAASNLPGSRVAEKNNEGVMQNNCGQGENGSYNKNDNFHCQGEITGLISRRLSMPRVNLQLAREKKKNRESITLRKASRQTIIDPPSFRELSDANRMMYKKKALDDFVLSYDMLSYRDLYTVDSSQWNPNESADSSRLRNDENEQEFSDLFVSYDNFYKYEDAISKLMKNNTSEAQSLLLDLAEQAMEPACYVRALVLFKELVKQCDVQNNAKENAEVMRKGKDDIKEAVELLEFCMDGMKPASSFLLGMMKTFNVGECSRFMAGSWQKDLTHVMNVAKSLDEDLELEQSILQNINHTSSWNGEECGIGMKKKKEYVKKMFKYSLYEVVQEMLSGENFNPATVNASFAVLSKGDDFPEGLYGYGSILIRDKVGGNFQENVKKAMSLLGRANLRGHEGAKLLLGTLPLKREVFCETQKEVMSCIRILEDYIRKSDNSCFMNKENVDKVALCLASEYWSGTSIFSECDKRKSEEILELRNLREKWDYIFHQSQVNFDDDSVFLIPSETEQPLCSTANNVAGSSSSLGFMSNYSAISKVSTKLSDPSVKNQNMSKELM